MFKSSESLNTLHGNNKEQLNYLKENLRDPQGRSLANKIQWIYLDNFSKRLVDLIEERLNIRRASVRKYINKSNKSFCRLGNFLISSFIKCFFNLFGLFIF